MTRWFGRALILLGCVALSLAARAVHSQGVTWTREFGPDGAPKPTVVWQPPVPLEQANAVTTQEPARVRLQAPERAGIPQAPTCLPTADTRYGRPELRLSTTSEQSPPAARLGAPLALPYVAVLHDAPVTVQYIPPLNRREATDQFAEGGFLLPASIELTLPGPQRLFRLDSEAAVLERIRQDARLGKTPTLIEFPAPPRFEEREKILLPRQWPLITELIQPCYVYHGRLTFEQINSERYGWSMGVVQPLVSALHFYADVATLPYHLAEDPCRYGDSSAGKCLPGDPVPLYLYPPHCSLTGLAAEAAVITPLFFAFP